MQRLVTCSMRTSISLTRQLLLTGAAMHASSEDESLMNAMTLRRACRCVPSAVSVTFNISCLLSGITVVNSPSPLASSAGGIGFTSIADTMAGRSFTAGTRCQGQSRRGSVSASNNRPHFCAWLPAVETQEPIETTVCHEVSCWDTKCPGQQQRRAAIADPEAGCSASPAGTRWRSRAPPWSGAARWPRPAP